MAEKMSDSDRDLEVVKPPPKRRRIIDPSAVASVPIYSNKVNACLHLKPTPSVLAKNDNAGDCEDAALCFEPSPPAKRTVSSVFVDSEEEESEKVNLSKEPEDIRSPSPPPPPGSPVTKGSTRARRKIHEINTKLGAVCSLLSPSPESSEGRSTRKGRRHLPSAASEQCEDDDIIIITPGSGSQSPLSAREESHLTAREIPLKFRCRTDLHKIPVMSSAPLSEAVDKLSIKLKVPPSRILLLKKEKELPIHLTANELGLSIADIIDCDVLAADDKQEADDNSSNIITVRLQGKDKGSAQEYSLHREAPLGNILSQYLSSMSGAATHTVHFLFDGTKIKHSQTPSQLDMEDGDVIEVWT
ncbi:NFATC2-interacting protein isoform 2-T2 [Polymixia lowei]